VRELKHVVEWAAAFSTATLSAETVRSALAQRASIGRADATALERKELRDVLERFAWNTDAAAEHLGLHRATLYRRMKRVGLAAP
jgi:transcriptional regulator of acetoin/glycerol metabolism